MKNTIVLGALLMLFGMVACNDKTQTQETIQDEQSTTEINQEPLANKLLTKEERDALTPDDVLQIFKDGNKRFMNNELTVRDHSQDVRKTVSGQYPKAVVLSCIDSRVPVEDVFNRGLGDIFVGRVAGNFANEDQLGGLEFATKVSGSKLVLIMGHEHCGAVKAAIDDVELGNITALLANIRPVVEKTDYEGVRASSNQEFVDMVCENNVRHTIEEIRKNSPILKEMEDNGEIKIIGGVYDLDTGKVEFLNE
ncbi:MAG: carbonic anhydrase family protein [Flavobacteriaceae bacterium]